MQQEVLPSQRSVVEASLRGAASAEHLTGTIVATEAKIRGRLTTVGASWPQRSARACLTEDVSASADYFPPFRGLHYSHGGQPLVLRRVRQVTRANQQDDPLLRPGLDGQREFEFPYILPDCELPPRIIGPQESIPRLLDAPLVLQPAFLDDVQVRGWQLRGR